MEAERYKIKIIGHTKIDNHTEYIISIEKNGVNFSFSERYKNLKALDDLMKKYTNNNAFPKFPPKKFFGSEDEKFIIKRQNEINNYFENISNSPEFSTLPPLLKFIEEKREKYGPSNKKNESQTPAVAQLKKDLESKQEKELKKSMKKTDDEYNKILNDLISQFYDMNNYYDKDTISDNNLFIKFFNNNKIVSNDSNKTIEPGNDNNFSLIYQKDSRLDSTEGEIKEKIQKLSNLYKSLDKNYDTKEIIVPV
jgi:predicted metal-dependent hydrolase